MPENYGILKTIKVKVKFSEKTNGITYRTVFRNKKQDGNYEYASLFIRFIQKAKELPINDNDFINIKDGFMSFNLDRDNNPHWTLVISDFDHNEELTKKYSENNEFSEFSYSEEDLPF